MVGLIFVDCSQELLYMMGFLSLLSSSYSFQFGFLPFFMGFSGIVLVGFGRKIWGGKERNWWG